MPLGPISACVGLALRIGEQRAPVATEVDVASQLPLPSASEENRFAGNVGNQVISGIRDFFDPPDTEPLMGENSILLALKPIGIEIGGAREGRFHELRLRPDPGMNSSQVRSNTRVSLRWATRPIRTVER